ncbi:MAG: Gldg family protein [Clostridia bacterium]|nr:Gldg family protein [Clostridia bacterium]
MLALYRLALKRYFSRLSTYVYLFFAAFAAGALSALFGLVMGYPSITYSLVYLLPVAMLLSPIPLLVSHNKKGRGETKLLFSLPASPVQSALSELLAAVTVTLFPYLILAILPSVFSFFGKVDLASAYVAIGGFYLFLCFTVTLLSVLMRLIGEKRLRAALAFGSMVLLYGINVLFSNLSVPKALSVLNPVDQFYGFTYGDLPIGGILYFLTLTASLAFALVVLCKRERGDLASKKRKRPLVLALSLVLLGCMGGNLLLPLLVEERALNPKVSDSRVYEISGASRDFVAALKEDVRIYYVSSGEKDRNLYAFAESYASLSPHLSLSHADPNSDEALSALYQAGRISEHSLVLVAKERYLILDAADLFHYYNSELELSLSAYQYDYYRAAYAHYAQTGSVGDYDITAVEYGARLAQSSATAVYFDGDFLLANGIAYVSDATLPTVAVLEKGEKASLDAVLESYMVQNGYFVRHTQELSSLQAVDLLLLCVTEDLTKKEAENLASYLDEGGRVLLLTSFEAVDLPNLYEVTSAYGLGVMKEENVVCSQNEDAYYSPDMTSYFLTNIAPCDATGDFNGYFVSLLSHAIEIEEREGVTVTPWLSTDNEGYLTLAEGEELTDEDGERLLGKYHVGVIAEKEDAVLIWLSSQLSASYTGNSMSGGGNFELLLSAMKLYTANSYTTMSIPSRQATESLLSVGTEPMLLWSLLLSLLLPAAFLTVGIVHVRKRKGR